MKKALLFLFCADILSVFGDDAALCAHMACAIFLPGEGDSPAVIDSQKLFVPKGEDDRIVNPVYEETFRKQSQSDFYAKSYPLQLVQVIYSPANRLPRNIYLKVGMGISESAPMYWLPFSLEARWVVVLRPLMDERRNLIPAEACDQAIFKGIAAYPFVDARNLMSVPLPQQDWAVCTRWPPKSEISIPSAVCAPEAFEEDIQTMADAFYGKIIPRDDAASRLSKMIPDLKTPLGQKIARAGLALITSVTGEPPLAQPAPAAQPAP